MPKTPPKDYYASMMVPGTKKIAIVSKRLGTKERLVQVALCTNENIADKIVEALNTHQGMIDKLEAPAHKRVEQLEETLRKAKVEYNEMRQKNNGLLHDVERLKRDVDRAILARDAAQAKAREAIGLTPTPT